MLGDVIRASGWTFCSCIFLYHEDHEDYDNLLLKYAIIFKSGGGLTAVVMSNRIAI